MIGVIKAIYDQIGSSRKFVMQSLLAAMVMVALKVPGPLLVRYLVDNVQEAKDHALLIKVLGAQLGLMVLIATLANLTGLFQTLVGADLAIKVGTRFFRHLTQLPLAFFDRNRTGDLVERYVESQGLVNSGAGLFNEFILAIIQALVFPAVLFLMDWRLTLLALAVYPLNILVYHVLNQAVFRRGKTLVRVKAQLRSRLVDYVGGIRTVQATDFTEAANREVNRHAAAGARAQYSLARAQYTGKFVSGVLRALGQAVFMGLGWHLVLKGDLTLGSLMAFTMYVGYMTGPLTSLLGLSTKLQNTRVTGERFLEVYSTPSNFEIHPNAAPREFPKFGDIHFENIRFSYGREPVLKEINATIPAGKMTAIVGRSGAGKSSLVNLLPRLYDPDSGRITIGGIDLRDLDVDRLRSSVGVVLQDSNFFWGSVRDFLTSGNSGVESSRLLSLLDNVGLSSWFRGLPQGLDSNIGEQGVLLSGGQRQRLALARVCLDPRPIIILDEPTSAVDPTSERLMVSVVEKMLAGSTVIVVAHGLFSIRKADQILVLDDGRVVESGSCDQLLRDNGLFAELFSARTPI